LRWVVMGFKVIRTGYAYGAAFNRGNGMGAWQLRRYRNNESGKQQYSYDTRAVVTCQTANGIDLSDEPAAV